jgi:hypothetical protein
MNTLEDYKETVKGILSELIDRADLLGLANILKSVSVNMTLPEEEQKEISDLHIEIMAQERITEQESL